VSKAVKIGPELPEGLGITRIDSSLPEAQQTAVVVEAGPDVVRTVDILGNIVETIMRVEKPKVETREQVAARVVSKYTDTNGNTVETY
jgi:hypothetical protein